MCLLRNKLPFLLCCLVASSLTVPVQAAGQFLEPRATEKPKQVSEMEIRIPVGEPVHIQFDQRVVGGFKPETFALNMELRGRSLLMTAPNGVPAKGSAVVVRLEDGAEVLLLLKRDDIP